MVVLGGGAVSYERGTPIVSAGLILDRLFCKKSMWVGNSVQEQKHAAHMLQACGLGSSQGTLAVYVLGRDSVPNVHTFKNNYFTEM